MPETYRLIVDGPKAASLPAMSLGIAILWISIGAAAGWFGSRIMGTFARPSALANISLGILGAVLAGFITQRSLGAASAPPASSSAWEERCSAVAW